MDEERERERDREKQLVNISQEKSKNYIPGLKIDENGWCILSFIISTRASMHKLGSNND